MSVVANQKRVRPSIKIFFFSCETSLSKEPTHFTGNRKRGSEPGRFDSQAVHESIMIFHQEMHSGVIGKIFEGLAQRDLLQIERG